MNIIQSKMNFSGVPKKYRQIDNFVSRSAQPAKEDFAWLKEQGVTDVFNFRTLTVRKVNFNEKDEVEALGMKYHSIPSVSSKPKRSNVLRFLKQVNDVKKRNGKAHIHCMAGKDRTGMYSYIYKMINNIGSKTENMEEWLDLGLDEMKYPFMMDWADNFLGFYSFLEHWKKKLHCKIFSVKMSL